MGNGPQVTDIVGFVCEAPQALRPCAETNWKWKPAPSLGSLSCALDNLASRSNPDEEDIEEYMGCLRESGFEGLYDKLKAFDPDEMVVTCMSNEALAEGDMAIGWSPGSEPTEEQLAALKKILEDAGLKVSRLEKDRFCYYG